MTRKQEITVKCINKDCKYGGITKISVREANLLYGRPNGMRIKSGMVLKATCKHCAMEVKNAIKKQADSITKSIKDSAIIDSK